MKNPFYCIGIHIKINNGRRSLNTQTVKKFVIKGLSSKANGSIRSFYKLNYEWNLLNEDIQWMNKKMVCTHL